MDGKMMKNINSQVDKRDWESYLSFQIIINEQT